MYGNDIYDDFTKGIIPRLINDIFNYIEIMDENITFQIKMSILQIYKENIFDMLTGENNLKIKENPIKGIYVDKLTEVYCDSFETFMEYIDISQENRIVSETKLNSYSSRSHSILIFEVTQNLNNANFSKKGTLNLVDLAGSEKISKTGAIGETLEEAKKINLSLSALGNVIHALTSNSDFIPYRDSKLTRILQESLGGNFKTNLIVTCSPHSYHFEETVSSLKFAQRVKSIKNKVKINIKLTYEELQKLNNELRKQLGFFKSENKQLKDLLNENNIQIIINDKGENGKKKGKKIIKKKSSENSSSESSFDSSSSKSDSDSDSDSKSESKSDSDSDSKNDSKSDSDSENKKNKDKVNSKKGNFGDNIEKKDMDVNKIENNIENNKDSKINNISKNENDNKIEDNKDDNKVYKKDDNNNENKINANDIKFKTENKLLDNKFSLNDSKNDNDEVKNNPNLDNDVKKKLFNEIKNENDINTKNNQDKIDTESNYCKEHSKIIKQLKKRIDALNNEIKEKDKIIFGLEQSNKKKQKIIDKNKEENKTINSKDISKSLNDIQDLYNEIKDKLIKIDNQYDSLKSNKDMEENLEKFTKISSDINLNNEKFKNNDIECFKGLKSIILEILNNKVKDDNFEELNIKYKNNINLLYDNIISDNTNLKNTLINYSTLFIYGYCESFINLYFNSQINEKIIIHNNILKEANSLLVKIIEDLLKRNFEISNKINNENIDKNANNFKNLPLNTEQFKVSFNESNPQNLKTYNRRKSKILSFINKKGLEMLKQKKESEKNDKKDSSHQIITINPNSNDAIIEKDEKEEIENEESKKSNIDNKEKNNEGQKSVISINDIETFQMKQEKKISKLNMLKEYIVKAFKVTEKYKKEMNIIKISFVKLLNEQLDIILNKLGINNLIKQDEIIEIKNNIKKQDIENIINETVKIEKEKKRIKQNNNNLEMKSNNNNELNKSNNDDENKQNNEEKKENKVKNKNNRKISNTENNKNNSSNNQNYNKDNKNVNEINKEEINNQNINKKDINDIKNNNTNQIIINNKDNISQNENNNNNSLLDIISNNIDDNDTKYNIMDKHKVINNENYNNENKNINDKNYKEVNNNINNNNDKNLNSENDEGINGNNKNNNIYKRNKNKINDINNNLNKNNNIGNMSNKNKNDGSPKNINQNINFNNMNLNNNDNNIDYNNNDINKNNNNNINNINKKNSNKNISSYNNRKEEREDSKQEKKDKEIKNLNLKKSIDTNSIPFYNPKHKTKNQTSNKNIQNENLFENNNPSINNNQNNNSSINPIFGNFKSNQEKEIKLYSNENIINQNIKKKNKHDRNSNKNEFFLYKEGYNVSENQFNYTIDEKENQIKNPEKLSLKYNILNTSPNLNLNFTFRNTLGNSKNSIEDIVDDYLNTGTATRRFDGIGYIIKNKKVKCLFKGGLNANKSLEITPIDNKIKYVKGDDYIPIPDDDN